MISNRSDVSIMFDSIVMRSSVFKEAGAHITIVLEHKDYQNMYDIDIIANSCSMELNIRENLIYDREKDENYITITILGNDQEIHQENIFLKTNVVGAIKIDKEIFLALNFRVINNSTSKIIVHNVKKFKLRDFKVIRSLGMGYYGNTYQVLGKSSKFYAVKVLNERMNINNKNDVAIREIIPLISLPEHPCLIKLLGFIYDHNFGIILVLEYASRGRIDEIGFKNLEIDMKYKILYGLFSCVAMLHEFNYIHRDIHPSNVLISEDYETKLIDFGVSRFLDQEMTQNIGHRGFKSPEMINTRTYDEFVDVYSIFFLLFDLRKNEQLIRKILHTLNNTIKN